MKSWYEEYKRRYAELKEKGKPFFPYTVAKDSVACFLVLCLLCFLAIYFGAKLESLADPTDTTYNPRPEWYFLFLFQMLKYFPGYLESIAAVFLPGAAVLFLALLPFLDRGPRKHPFRRPLWSGMAILSLLGIAYLTWAGFKSPLTNPVVDRDPLVVEGKRIYRNLSCVYCHRMSGEGGSIGPDLTSLRGDWSEDWLKRHFKDPQSVVPGSAMPKLNLLDDEIDALVSYLLSLGGDGPYTDEASSLFVENCAACHRVGKEGSDLGPDLSFIGTARDKNYISKYITDPSLLNSDSTMPGYQGLLTETQIEDLSRYLAAQKGF